jgi:hypothetical protein
MKRPKDINIVIGIGIFTLIAMTAYWYAWFFAPDVVQSRVPSDPDYAVYVGYEQAFPLPYARHLEDATLPNLDRIVKACLKLMEG